MSSIGEKLRRQRIERGADLEQITRETKISPRLLEAIEAEEFDKLPGGVFRRRFVEQYARALAIDENEIQAELEQLFPDLEPVILPASGIERFSDWHPRYSGWLGSLAAVVVVMLACAGIYEWWQNSRRPLRASPAEKAASTTENPRPVTSEPAPSLIQPTAAAPSAPEEAKVRVTITATEPSWFSATSDGKPVFAGQLEANQAMSFYAAEKLKIFTGNAGGLEITLNNKAVGSIGPSGRVRTVYLTPDGFQVVQPKPRTSESL